MAFFVETWQTTKFVTNFSNILACKYFLHIIKESEN